MLLDIRQLSYRIVFPPRSPLPSLVRKYQTKAGGFGSQITVLWMACVGAAAVLRDISAGLCRRRAFINIFCFPRVVVWWDIRAVFLIIR